MATDQSIRSILLVDCGSAITKAILLDRVAGQYRFVARGESPTTMGSSWSDITDGIHHAIEQIAEVTGRVFFSGEGNLISPELSNQQGVDVFAATASCSQPLGVVIGGLVRDMSVASAERAAAGTYSQVRGVLASNGEGGLTEDERVHTIYNAEPDVVCIAGGLEDGATVPVLRLADTAALACSLIREEDRPQILYAGNSRLRERIVRIVEGRAELRVANNVRPTAGRENLVDAQTELSSLYSSRKMRSVPGVRLLDEWSPIETTPTARAFSRLIEYLWHLGDPDRGVLGIDVGAANTTIAAAFDGQLYLTVKGNRGTVYGPQELLETYGAEAFTAWLPESMKEGEILGILLNKEMHPTSIPQVQRELWLEQAIARASIRSTLEIARPGWKPGEAQPYPDLLPLCDTIVVSGGILARAPHPGQAALIVLDSLQPIGVSTLVLDRYGLAPALGNVAAVKPIAAVEALDSGGFVNLATVIAPVGEARRGDTILKVRIKYEDGSAFSVEVHYGELEVLPLLPNQEAIVELKPRRHFDVGLGGPGRGGRRRVSGGLAGLVIDARGRPLRLSRDPKRRQAQMQQWLWDVGG